MKEIDFKTNMDLIKIYNEVLNRINLIKFNDIWQGFKKYSFALYDDKKAIIDGIVITKPDSFIANTCIEYGGKNIAIYNALEFNGDYDDFTSNIVHEMFHCYQKEMNEERFIDDLLLLSYPLKIDNLNIKYNENVLITKMIKNNDYSNFGQVIYLRNRRYGIIKDVINQEYLAETFEGAAEYASTIALKQLSFTKYEKRISRYCNIVCNEKNILNIRKISYYIGTLLLIIYNKNKYNVFNFNNESFFNQIKDLIKAEKIDISNNGLLTNIVLEETKNRKEQIDSFILNKKFITFNSQICGYDPMNMIRFNNYILCSHFIFLNHNNEITRIMKPACLVMEDNSNFNVIGYYI